MITITCRGCDAPSVDVSVPAAFSGANDEKLFEAISLAGFERCGHCATYYHRIECLTFHKAPTDRPVPFSSRRAERTERRRLARLARQEAA